VFAGAPSIEEVATTGRRSRVVPARAGPTGYGLVQLTPVAGAALPVAVKPNEVVPPAATLPLYEALRTVTAPLAPVLTPFQMLLMLCPPAMVKCTDQPFRAVEPALATTTSAWNPPGQELLTCTAAVQPPEAGVVVGGVLVGGVVTGVVGGVVTGVVGGVVTGVVGGVLPSPPEVVYVAEV
jgi:hypothetical protein